MPTLRTSKEVESWLIGELRATPRRETKHGTLFFRVCPWCGRQLRILVPRSKNPISEGTLASIYRQAHAAPGRLPSCPRRPLGQR